MSDVNVIKWQIEGKHNQALLLQKSESGAVLQKHPNLKSQPILSV